MRLALLALVALGALATATPDAKEDEDLAKRIAKYPPGTRAARTSLHVTGGSDPLGTETLHVRTRSGEVASIVVKRRGAKTSSTSPVAAPPAPVAVASAPVAFHEEQPVLLKAPAVDAAEQEKTIDEQITLSVERVAKLLGAVPSAAVPAPVAVRSDVVWVKGEGGINPKQRGGRGLVWVGGDGVPVVEGTRVPDDEADRTRTWRNARVINNVLVQNDETARPPQNDEDQSNRASSEEESEERQRLLESIRLVNARQVRSRVARRLSFPTDTSSSAASSSSASAEGSSSSGTASSSSSDPPSGELQARLLLPASAFHAPMRVRPYRAGATPTSRVSFEEGVRTPVLHYAHPELGVQPAAPAPGPKVARSRQDNAMRPLDKSQQAEDELLQRQEAALAHFARDAHSDRSPFAVEPALDSPEAQDAADAAQAASALAQEEATAARVSWDRRGRDGPAGSNSDGNSASSGGSPAQAWPQPARRPTAYLPDDAYPSTTDKYLRKYPSAYPYGKDSYTRYAGVNAYGNNGNNNYGPYNNNNGNDYKYGNTRYGNQFGNADSSYAAGNNPSSYGINYGHYDVSSSDPASQSPWSSSPATAAFWLRLGEELRSRLSDGMARVGDFTRPVVQPILDATQRLGHNLGLTSPPAPPIYAHMHPHGPLRAAHVVASGTPHRGHRPNYYEQQRYPHDPYHFQEKARLLDADAILIMDDSDASAPQDGVVEAVAEALAAEEEGSAAERREQQLRRRRRRSLGDDFGANALDGEEQTNAGTGAVAAAMGAVAGAWSDTPCAKRIFCEEMLRRAQDDVMMTEKRMAAAYHQLGLSDYSVAFHLGDVMAAVRNHDCSAFSCPTGVVPNLSAKSTQVPSNAAPRR